MIYEPNLYQPDKGWKNMAANAAIKSTEIPPMRPTPPMSVTLTVTPDTLTIMQFEANKKSVGPSYILWLFLGLTGAHRFYNGKIGTGFIQLAMFLLWAASLFMFFPILFISVPWVLIDAFLIPSWIRDHNAALITKLTGP
jgi:TM2 domain-containing membrane protein YozV